MRPPLDQFVDEDNRRAARQQVAAVCAAVIAGLHVRGDLFRHQRRTDRHAGAQRLAECHQVRLQAKRGRVKRTPGPAETALDFVCDEERPGAAARLRNRVCGGTWQRPHAAFALYRLDDDRGCIPRDRRRATPSASSAGTNVTPLTSGANGVR